MEVKRDLTLEEKLEIIRRNENGKEELLSILIDLQNASPEGYIDQETAALVAKEVGMTETKIYEVITFYAMLKTKPQAKYVMKICNSSPCHFSKVEFITETLEKLLGVSIGEDTPDGMFAYHFIPCVGACDIGPVIKIKDTVYGNLDEQKIQQLVEDLKQGLRDQ
jgi:NADH-quinone oxidoreductase subunit E